MMMVIVNETKYVHTTTKTGKRSARVVPIRATTLQAEDTIDREMIAFIAACTGVKVESYETNGGENYDVSITLVAYVPGKTMIASGVSDDAND